MSDAELTALAEQAGVMVRWRDYRGRPRQVSPPTLRSVLAALGFPSANDAEIRESAQRIRQTEQGRELPPLVVADAGEPIALPLPTGRFRVLLEEGAALEGNVQEFAGGAALPRIDVPGYHVLEIGSAQTALAIAPSRAFPLPAAGGTSRRWGLTVQLYSLRRPGDGGIGDFTALGQFVRSAASRGAAAVAISPVHAQFNADPDRFSPYAPSSRLALNVLHADPDAFGEAPDEDPASKAEREPLELLGLIDWPAATRARLARFRAAYARFRSGAGELRQEFDAWRARRADLEAHARFEALHAHLFGADRARWHWRSWPDQFRSPRNPAVEAFAREHAAEVSFHSFLQFLAERQLAAAQAEAHRAGMSVGLICDLAVGTDSGGSQGWSRQEEMLLGLTIGAPPDLLNTQGQNWGVVAFSPTGLARHGYGAFIDMLRAALRHTGGMRIDHAMSLGRLWMIPEGADPTEGAYVRFPLADLLRLVALESQRNRGIVLAEDLGTVPEGFQDQLERRGIMGMRVLWFEREGEAFSPPRNWSRCAVAMTSTHDLPTVGGWWSARDLDWRRELHLLGDQQAVAAEYETRRRDRVALWRAFRDSGAARGHVPPPEQPECAVDAAVRHVGGAACELVMLPLEDALAEREQPNLPGTTHQHPNWRRRTPRAADRLLDEPEVAARIAGLAAARAQ